VGAAGPAVQSQVSRSSGLKLCRDDTHWHSDAYSPHRSCLWDCAHQRFANRATFCYPPRWSAISVNPAVETIMPTYRSRTTTHGRNMAGARGLWRATGMKDADFGKPIIAVVNSFTQF
jgi:hypothetical protein